MVKNNSIAFDAILLRASFCILMQVFELQQQLRRVELQLHEQEVLVEKINNLEKNNRDLSDTLSALREKHHEEKTSR